MTIPDAKREKRCSCGSITGTHLLSCPFSEDNLNRSPAFSISDGYLQEITDEQRRVITGAKTNAEARAIEERYRALANDRGTGALDDGNPQTVTLSSREYERYLCGALNEPQLAHDPDGDLRQIRDAVEALLDSVAPDRDDHTADTPLRAAKMWRELLRGEGDDPKRYLAKTFSAPRDAGLVVQSGIEMTSVCAHHLLPFTGKATVAYRPSPGQRVVGLSKLTRVLQAYAARLQIQERIGAQVIEAINEVLLPSGCMCVITATHDCMRLRGVRDHGSGTTTVAAAGMLTPEEVSFIHAAHLHKLG